jgi:hypothetical protein
MKSAEGGIRTLTPYGATPSRWCVCQFRHFRTGMEINNEIDSSLPGKIRQVEAPLREYRKSWGHGMRLCAPIPSEPCRYKHYMFGFTGGV